jgi:tetratricopeptide (TPR) repeat protein
VNEWGEDIFLDLVEGVALLTSGAAILLICMARPELRSRRSEWPVALRLEPLDEQAVDELIGDLAHELRRRVAAAAGGNPLFLTEMRTMAEENAQVDVPATLRALLAARLDQLDPAERRVLETGGVEGEIFHRGAVQALAPEERQLTPRLAALVRRELIRPDRTQLPGDDGFGFRHILIRDAAYDALPKSARRDLHERFADWLEERGADLVELDEILGYHLEQAARCSADLGQPNPALAVRAGDRLKAAARRSLRPGNELPARRLLSRSLALTRPHRLDIDREVDLAVTFHTEAPERAAATCEAAAERARAEGDERGEAHARAVAAVHRIHVEAEPDVEELERLARRALPMLEEAGDHTGLAQVWVALGYGVANARGRMEDWAYAAEQSIRHVRASGWQSRDDFGLLSALIVGPRPADEALRMLDEWLPDPSEPPEPLPELGRSLDTKEPEWIWRQVRARVHSQPGEHAEAEQLGREAVAIVERTDQLTHQGDAQCDLAEVLAAADRSEEAVDALEQALDRYERKKNLAMVAQVRPRLEALRAGSVA